MRTPVKIAAALLLIAGAAFAYSHYAPLALSGVEVAIEACEPAGAPGMPMATSAQGQWQGTTYRLAVEQVENCGVSLQGATVQRLGRHLLVRTQYRSPADGTATGCTCRHRSTVAIPGLPHQDFMAHVYSWP